MSREGPERPPAWWRGGVVYQIYPRSFQDSDGDGIGDLRGVLSRLDHLERLGVDAVWISPIYPSPMADFGYDVSDYCDVHPLFGTLDDLDRLVADLHARGMRLILDFVPNHTSSEHPWFKEARRSRDDPRRDWYIWRDPAPGGGPPNNWLSNAGGPAWTLDEATGQYYYHAFLPEQPDLNWRNPAVREAMHDALRFWLGCGVDGFRVDVIWHLMKDPDFRDNPPNPAYREGIDPPFASVQQLHNADHPDIHEVVAGMRRVLEEFPGDRLLIGEIYLPVERLAAYYGKDLEGAHLPFNFQLISAAWHAPTLRHMIKEYEAALPFGGWPNWVLGNHDQPRIASRVGRAQARVAAALLLTLRGTPTLYYGDEIGMENVPIPPERERDPFGMNMPGTGQGRDPERTPMQWDGSENAGFTTGDPWLPLAPDWREVNVEAQRRDPRSMLSLVQALLDLRRREPALSLGSYRTLSVEGDVLVYARSGGGDGARTFVVALNLTPEPRAVAFADGELPGGRIVLSTHMDRGGEPVGDAGLALRGDEGVVVEVAAAG
jgi:alpha-glucosidase